MESVGGWSKGGKTGHAKLGTESGDGCRLWSTSCCSEGNSEGPSEDCWSCIAPCEDGGSDETTTISDALPQRSVCLCPAELKATVSGEGFEPTGNGASDSWTDVAGIAGVWANTSVALVLKKEPAFDEGCMPSERGLVW